VSRNAIDTTIVGAIILVVDRVPTRAAMVWVRSQVRPRTIRIVEVACSVHANSRARAAGPARAAIVLVGVYIRFTPIGVVVIAINVSFARAAKDTARIGTSDIGWLHVTSGQADEQRAGGKITRASSEAVSRKKGGRHHGSSPRRWHSQSRSLRV